MIPTDTDSASNGQAKVETHTQSTTSPPSPFWPPPSPFCCCLLVCHPRRGSAVPCLNARVPHPSRILRWVGSQNSREPRRRCRRLFYPLASNTILNGVSAALRKCVNPPPRTTFSNLAGPACAPSPSPTSCASEQGTHTVAEAE